MPSPAAVSSAVHAGCLLLRSSRRFRGKEGESKAEGKSCFVLQKSPTRVVFSAGTQAANKASGGLAEVAGAAMQSHPAQSSGSARHGCMARSASCTGPGEISTYPSPPSPEGLTRKVSWGPWFGSSGPGDLQVPPSIAAASWGFLCGLGVQRSRCAQEGCLGGLIVQQSSGFTSFYLVGVSTFTNTDLQSPCLRPLSCHLLEREHPSWGRKNPSQLFHRE